MTLFRSFSGSPGSETGDRLISCYAHFFTRQEIESELLHAGYTIMDYYDAEYGCAIASPKIPEVL